VVELLSHNAPLAKKYNSFLNKLANYSEVKNRDLARFSDVSRDEAEYLN